ncbi:MAG: hypothetical protein K2L82_02055 [Lachnospiraceae bacterium]|nr:hypothetical protein [Lachnospiraceae bacterium]
MSFLRLKQYKSNKSTAHSLRAYLDTVQGSQMILSICKSIKRASFISFRQLIGQSRKGSMTLEAAFVLPFFLFAVINILFAVNIIGTQSRINAALHQTGNKMAFAGYVYERTAGNVLPDSLASVAMTSIYARGQVLEYVGTDYLNQSCIVGGLGGISFAGSSVMEKGDMIDIVVSYRVKPFAGIMGFKGFAMTQRYYGRAWTGYDVTQYVSDSNQEDPMVYITETGTVYHSNRNCTYLNPSVESVAAEAVGDMRNQSGAKFYSCEVCSGYRGVGQVYITRYGGSYHSQINCSKLKRTIYTVPLSQVGGRGRCSKCG